MQHQQYAQARLSQPALLILASLTQEHYLFPGQEPGQGQALPLPYSGNYIILPDSIKEPGQGQALPQEGSSLMCYNHLGIKEPGQGQALPLPYTDQLVPAVYGRGDRKGRPGSVPKGWCWCCWCCCSSSPGRPLSLPNSPDFWMLLVTWFLAGVVGIITALLVKSPGEKQARRATQPSRRDLSPMVWPAIFPMLFFLLTLPGVLPLFDVSLPVWARLSYCLFAVFVSGMTVLIVTIRGSKPRFEKPLQVWGVFIPAVLFIPLVLLPGPGYWLLV